MHTLKELEKRYLELERELLKPEAVRDKSRYTELTREFNNVAKLLGLERKIDDIAKEIEGYKSLRTGIERPRSGSAVGGQDSPESDDERFIGEIDEEIEKLEKEKSDLERRREIALIPEDPHEGRDIIMEIRAGTGGEEAALFAADLFRMYSRYCERQSWKVDILSSNSTGIGGFKEIIFSIAGSSAYRKLKYETGVHRVQRIPVTEASGRIHTSAVTVAMLPEAEETDIQISPDELRIDVFRSMGHGGQSVNTTDSAVRITHLPTGVVVTCQDEKSQHKNKDKALKVLRARLYEMAERAKREAEARERKSQVGSGDRSEKIRTYNFPQNRVTDHRIGFTLHKLNRVLDGEIDELVDALQESEIAKQLESIGVKKRVY